MTTTLQPIPQPIADAADAIEREWAIAGTAPTWAQLHRPGRPTLYLQHQLLTIADLEQVSEGHTRRARIAIRRYIARSGSRHSRRTAHSAAEHIVRARLYAILRLDRMGVAVEERVLPFPRGSADDVAEWDRAEDDA